MLKKTSNWRLIFLHNSKVAMLIVKYSKPLTKGEFIKDGLMTMVEKFALKRSQSLLIFALYIKL